MEQNNIEMIESEIFLESPFKGQYRYIREITVFVRFQRSQNETQEIRRKPDSFPESSL